MDCKQHICLLLATCLKLGQQQHKHGTWARYFPFTSAMTTKGPCLLQAQQRPVGDPVTQTPLVPPVRRLAAVAHHALRGKQ
mmetsp:Transcript_1521/g.3692  ORF Transcript_1521/g.3692 Transcript_1521/m.3692 type:complete len:81 (-) Transcript_1521:1556-1798(-)